MQVRIDDDVIPLLEASKAAHGGSLSKAANRLLRASASKRPNVRTEQNTRPVVSAMDVVAHEASRATVKTAPKRVGRCPHPLLRRIGNECAVCGSTV